MGWQWRHSFYGTCRRHLVGIVCCRSETWKTTSQDTPSANNHCTFCLHYVSLQHGDVRGLILNSITTRHHIYWPCASGTTDILDCNGIYPDYANPELTNSKVTVKKNSSSQYPSVISNGYRRMQKKTSAHHSWTVRSKYSGNRTFYHGYHSPDRKNPRLFWMKLHAICRTNAHILIQILREHHVWKMNYSTRKNR